MGCDNNFRQLMFFYEQQVGSRKEDLGVRETMEGEFWITLECFWSDLKKNTKEWGYQA